MRETVPDHFFRRADEVVNVDVSVDTLRTRLRQGKIYGVEKIEQSLNNFFRKGNTLDAEGAGAASGRAGSSREGARLPRARRAGTGRDPRKGDGRDGLARERQELLRTGSRIAGRLASDWYAVYVETPREEMGRIRPEDYAALREHPVRQRVGAKVVKLKARRVADALIDFARREGITHVVFGQSSRTRWDILLHGSVITVFWTRCATPPCRSSRSRQEGTVAAKCRTPEKHLPAD